MKKLFFIGLAAAAMLASCSNDETVEQAPQKAISFSTFVNNGTRNIDPSITKETIKDFDVYGFTQKGQIFNGKDVTKDANTWKYANIQYWVEGNLYTFGALAPANKAIVNSSQVEGTMVTMNASFENDGMTDLLHAAPAQVDFKVGSTAAPVGMDFKHQLSKVKFSFLNNVGEGYNVKVTKIAINDAFKNANLNVAVNNTWTDQAGTLALNFGDAVIGTASADGVAMPIANAATGVSYEEKLLIPSAGKNYNVTFTVELLKGEVSLATYNHTATISGVELKLGYCYNFAATLTAQNINPDNTLQPIEFTVNTVEDWNHAEVNQNLPVPTIK